MALPKQCSACCKASMDSEFGYHRHNVLYKCCVECRVKQQAYRVNDTEKISEYSQTYYNNNVEKLK
eukprot:7049135-Heterocapsa_arctica.AAC.1